MVRLVQGNCASVQTRESEEDTKEFEVEKIVVVVMKGEEGLDRSWGRGRERESMTKTKRTFPKKVEDRGPRSRQTR